MLAAETVKTQNDMRSTGRAVAENALQRPLRRRGLRRDKQRVRTGDIETIVHDEVPEYCEHLAHHEKTLATWRKAGEKRVRGSERAAPRRGLCMDGVPQVRHGYFISASDEGAPNLLGMGVN